VLFSNHKAHGSPVVGWHSSLVCTEGTPAASCPCKAIGRKISWQRPFHAFSICNTQSESVHQSNRRKYIYAYQARLQKKARYLAISIEKNTSEFYSPNSKIMVVSTDMSLSIDMAVIRVPCAKSSPCFERRCLRP
jgi:hypothetical protein